MMMVCSPSSFLRNCLLLQLGVSHIKYQLAAISTFTRTNKTRDYQDEDFFRFTRGRFVYDEAEQLRQRHVEHSINELAATAAKAIGARKCIDVRKCPDGLYNKAFLLTMDNGNEVISKIPNPNAGPAHLTTASEVATMDFARNILHTPVPHVYAWNSRINEENRVGAEYIIMEKASGVPLGLVWDSLEPPDKLKVFLQVFKYQKRWAEVKFSQFGSLYYSKDLTADALSGSNLYTDEDGRPVKDNRFAVGPTVSREWLQNGRQNLQCYRGPWSSLLDYRMAIGCREGIAIRTLKQFPKQCVMFCGPGAYQPTLKKKLAAVELYPQILQHILPRETGLTSGHLWHNDLHAENIFVNPNKPTEIMGIIDWQSLQIAPLTDHCLDPSFLGYEGPDVGDDPQPPTLREDIDSLEQDARRAAIKQFYDTSVMVAWRMLVKGKNPDQHAAIRFRKSKAGHMLNLSQNLFVFGEAHFRALALDLRDEWAESGKEFPLKFSAAEISEIETDVKAADIGLGVINMIMERMGNLWPEKGFIHHEDYEAAMAMLRDIKGELMEKVVHSPEDKQAFEMFWPFDC
ncbi:phosphotransferase enzyme family protein [Nannizzia gypsea CBS 118893]|uniref:Altered inheritance of mitochondria protein 9, mitochondrial n=1 Tax=Arthroderma gypseum (strain ATCC MYA-4604 / CBS 118893) TaxID=535722 RepID=E4UVE4_ARTGP|nr:phosphotransferase enzyme family protein [Nannizzia gypsea CBS 118893]EFR02271.1 phosphotransferase enzyme family protein [Nannizzia gypsea CBS 118893]